MQSYVRPNAIGAVVLVLAGCVGSLPRDRGYAETGVLVERAVGVAPSWPPPDTPPEMPDGPLSVEQAVRLAFLHNPRIRLQYARLGLGRAELESARRLANPAFGWSRLDVRDGAGSQLTRSLTLGFSDALLWPARKRFAAGELARLQQAVAAELLTLATDVESAWIRAVSASQVSAMRALVAEAATASAELAQRLFDAGNLDRLALAREQAAAVQARIAAARAQAGALKARTRLAGLLGLSSEAGWRTPSELPVPGAESLDADALVELALEQRLDLAAARQRVRLREDALGVTRRWRWLGGIHIGAEREREPDGGVLRGPTLEWELPLFDQGQSALARADAELLQARARLDGLLLEVQNGARLGVEKLRVAQDIAARYREALVPQREAVVARMQERVNFMLVGVFELLQAKQEEYDAWQEYLEAVRDCWLARAELAHLVGGALPGPGLEAPLPGVGADSRVPAATPMDHGAHGHHHHMQHDDGGPAPAADAPQPHDHGDAP